MTSDNATVVTTGSIERADRPPPFEGDVFVNSRADCRYSTTPRIRYRDSKIAPPEDVRVPFFNPGDLDFEYADAVWETTTSVTDDARRLARAIDWLDFAAWNATSLTNDLRVPALQAGFEVLLDRDDSESIVGVRIGRFLSDLLTPGDPLSTRTWPKLKGEGETSRELTDLAWWFVRFSFLRNALMHGYAPTNEQWVHAGEPT